jgi:hypothetical protein
MHASVLNRYKGYQSLVKDVPAGLSFVGCLTALLNHAGRAVSYAYLAGVTGEAFKSHYRYDDPRVCFFSEIDFFEAATRATGVRFDLRSSGALDQAWARVRAAIDAGRPLLTSHAEALVITGYRDGAIVFWDEAAQGEPREMALDQFARTWSAWYPGAEMQGFLTATVGEMGALPDRRAVALQALKQGLSLSRPHWGPRGAHAGSAAYAAFAADLRNTPSRDFAQGREWLGLATVDHLARSKLAAAAFLREISDDLPEAARPHLERAASLYAQENQCWDEWRRLTHPFDPSDHSRRNPAADAILNCARCQKQVVLELESAAQKAESPPP